MKKFHIAYCIASLLAASDEAIAEAVSGGTVEEMRESLKAMLNDGIEFLTVTDCDNMHKNGSCAGHEAADELG
jgi:hypothetical protein